MIMFALRCFSGRGVLVHSAVKTTFQSFANQCEDFTLSQFTSVLLPAVAAYTSVTVLLTIWFYFGGMSRSDLKDQCRADRGFF